MNEIWRPVYGFECSYEISSAGNIRSVSRSVNNRWGTLRPVASREIKTQVHAITGYESVLLYKFGKAHRKLIHRLVAEAFIENIQNKPQVNHKNGIKTDNQVGNLEWNTASENCIHALANKLYETAKGESRHNSKLTESDIREIRSLAAMGIWHKTIAEKYPVGRKAITKIVNLQRWGHVI